MSRRGKNQILKDDMIQVAEHLRSKGFREVPRKGLYEAHRFYNDSLDGSDAFILFYRKEKHPHLLTFLAKDKEIIFGALGTSTGGDPEE